MANEVVFARQFLSQLDALPTKLSPDHVEDPRSYPARAAYILPRPPKAMSKPQGRAAAPGSDRSVAVSLRSLRNPPLDIKLAPQPVSTTSVQDVKAAAAEQAGLPADKMKLLFKKKPVADSKTLAELLEGSGDGDTAVVEFTVMVLGGAVPSRPAAGAEAGDVQMKDVAAAAAPASTSTAQGVSGVDVLKTDDFWTDLNGFLLQRVRDEKVADEVSGLFRKAWENKS
ncbi:uncharacterized protein PpBr36_06289 [Pyricularia pennisetigena]|uniref:uncharacterized protein n=1 Tax=Pyricularia pennisetigena TaxID=1578925 RepID=UPI0011538151|nr:uncharacterized protein PpBr36_06289 [Pyricularia pennisetigena]TLS23072.1 hypothetical protein PpBr36_06289 [Pyricularia pennisetigena]